MASVPAVSLPRLESAPVLVALIYLHFCACARLNRWLTVSTVDTGSSPIKARFGKTEIPTSTIIFRKYLLLWTEHLTPIKALTYPRLLLPHWKSSVVVYLT